MKNGSARALVISFLILVPLVAVAQTSTSTACVPILAHLTLGSDDTETSGQVSVLQQFLIQTNASSSLTVTGYFGRITAGALRQFQILQGLQPTGTVTASTSVAIEAACLANANVSFSVTNLLSLSAAPSLSGTAQGFSSPLVLSITPVQGGAPVYENEAVPVMNGSWTATAPPLPLGQYGATLSTQGFVLATSTLAIGISSVPAVLPDQESLPVSDVVDGRLMRFAIHAGTAGAMLIGQLTFTVATSNTDVSGLELYAFTDPSFSVPATTSAQGNVVNDLPIDPSSGEFSVIPDTPVTIPSGTTYFFELDGTVLPSDTQYFVTTKLLGDSFKPNADTFANLQSNGSNFIWSPDTFGQTATTDADWVNGSVISGLGTGLSMTRTDTPPPPPPPQPVETITVATTSSVSSFAGTTSSATSSTATSSSSSSGTATSTATTTPAGSFTATPTSGASPLKVTFAGSVNASKSCSASTFTMYYGDSSMTLISVSSKLCKALSFSLVHQYSKNGTYISGLYSGVYSTTSTSSKLIQSKTITVGTTKTALLNANLAAVIATVSFDLYDFFKYLLGFFRG